MAFEPTVDGAGGFPSFLSLFDPEPRYLALLHLPSGDPIFDQVDAAVRSSAACATEVAALFESRNHRCHLVGAAALLAGASSAATLDGLWAALDAGTWAAPQVAAAAFVVDADFEERARKRLITPGGWPKLMGSLAALYRQLPAPRVTVLARLDDPQLTGTALARDGAHYAREWLDRLRVVAPAAMRAGWVRP